MNAPQAAVSSETAAHSNAGVESTGLLPAIGLGADRPTARGRWQGLLPHSWLG
jgi:hypothetical protein